MTADRHLVEEPGGPRILIVDDEPAFVELLSDVLTDAGYAVATATQSLHVVEDAKAAQPDLILLDLMMPYLDGFDQLRLFSLHDDLKAVPIIVITANPRALDGIADLQALGIVASLAKPFENAALLDKISTALGRHTP